MAQFKIWVLPFLWLSLLPAYLPAAAPLATGSVVVVRLAGAIGPASADYLLRSLDKARDADARLFVVVMDTPGGLDTAMREIIRAILASPVPVATFVAPSGARAASAGTYILYASHVAAMAPATNLGAATPVQIGGFPGAPDNAKPGNEKDTPVSGDAMERKMINDAVAYLQGLARLRGRNVAWAEKAVREAASLSADDALAARVIDLIASDVPDLLRQLQGRTLQADGRQYTLDVGAAPLVFLEPDWRNRLLSIITDPSIAYILMLIGIYGLIFEFSNPGAVAPGVIGAISLLLALFAFQLLPVNYAGLGLIVLGVILMVAEAFVPSFGALGIGGIVAFVIGSVMLMDTEVPGYGVSPSLIGAIALVSSMLFTAAVAMAVRARRRPVVSGVEQLRGAAAVALEDFNEQGKVRVHGEIWRAVTHVPVHLGQRLRVTAVDGLTLQVESLPETTQEKTT